MPLVKDRIEIEDIMEALDLADLPAGCQYKAGDALVLEVDVSQGEIDDHATEEDAEPEFISLDQGDLRDGLLALAKGDVAMAQTLLGRALQEDSDACRVVEEVLR